jgi:hypothetical protein
MFDPEPAELDQVRRAFGLHELAVEDAQSFHLRPKLDHYDDGVSFMILRTARYDDAKEEVEFGEISVFLGATFVITVRQGVASDLHGARLRLEQHPDLLQAGPSAVLWAILDKVVDDYAPVVEGLERDIEEVEATVFSGAAAATERIYFLRREVTDFYRAVHPLLGPLEGLTRADRGRSVPELLPYLRDVHDHLRLVNEEVAAQRDLLTTVLEANMAVISVQQTQISVSHRVPAAVVHRGLLRPELRVADRPHDDVRRLRRLRARRPARALRRAALRVPAVQIPVSVGVSRSRGVVYGDGSRGSPSAISASSRASIRACRASSSRRATARPFM